MGSRYIRAIIDSKTGKISIIVDGYPHNECITLTQKIAGKSTPLKTKNDLKEKIHSEIEEDSEEKEKEELNER
ncbi:MAG TPA: hypothetical protein QF644_04440 [Candidatus Poseidoniaceae archaeon]|nr:hypothetical protein [Candidatus Poseidoniaceae archaeon]